jgi:hypothetical protein
LISLVAATFEKANTYVFAAPIIRDREVGGSNPLAPTNYIKHLRLPAKVAVLVLWLDCWQTDRERLSPLQPQLAQIFSPGQAYKFKAARSFLETSPPLLVITFVMSGDHCPRPAIS